MLTAKPKATAFVVGRRLMPLRWLTESLRGIRYRIRKECRSRGHHDTGTAEYLTYMPTHTLDALRHAVSATEPSAFGSTVNDSSR